MGWSWWNDGRLRGGQHERWRKWWDQQMIGSGWLAQYIGRQPRPWDLVRQGHPYILEQRSMLGWNVEGGRRCHVGCGRGFGDIARVTAFWGHQHGGRM